MCAGSGGVGKTTISAALGVRAAQLGLRALVLTVDPAQRLATSLGLDLKSDDERPVPLSQCQGCLNAAVIHSKKVFDQFIASNATQPEIARRILNNRLYQQMSTTLSGSQEFTALERLLLAVESEKYDVVILDTPPTKHAMDFLMAPQRINALFQDATTKWFFAPQEKLPGFLTNLVSMGTRTVLKSLEVLTGGQFIEELIDFFASVKSIQGTLRDRSVKAHNLLIGPETKFVLVTSFDAAKLMEARHLVKDLSHLGYTLDAVVINRAFPLGLPKDLDLSGKGDSDAYEKVLKYYREFKDFYSVRYNLYEEFARSLSSQVQVARVPEYQQDVQGLGDLEKLALTLAQGQKA